MFEMFQDMGGDAPSTASGSIEKIFVLSVGGSVIASRSFNTALIAKIAHLINQLHGEGYKFAIVVGGGKIARDYIAAAKTLGANNFINDEIAIRITRANALLLVQALDKAYPDVVKDIQLARNIIDEGRIPVFGGLLPGFTTDTVAALVAEFLGATFVNLTNVDGIYSADPKTSKNATRFDKLSFERLKRIVARADLRKPGSSVVLDSFTASILARSKIKTIVLDAEDLSNLENALRGGEFTGTTVDEAADAAPAETEDKDDLDDVEY